MSSWLDRNVVLKSKPFKVFFAGFKSDTLTLQRNGWNLMVEHESDHLYHRHSIRFILKHEMLDLVAMTYTNSLEFQDFLHDPFVEEKVIFSIHALGKDIRVTGYPTFDLKNIRDIDATPNMVSANEITSIRDLFTTLIKPDNALIVEPDQISELLKKIVECQSPKQAEIRERIRSGELRENMKQTLHAQILSVAA